MQGPLRPDRGGPDVPGPHRRGDRPDRDLGHGRAAPRGARRPHAARVQGRRHRRQAAGRLPRDHHPARSTRSPTPTRSRPVARASSPRSRSPSSPRVPAAATSSSTRSPVVASPRSTSPRSTPASRSAMTAGVLAGYPTVDVRATLIDGKYHDVDSSEMAFKIAGTMAFKEAARKAKPVLLEPIMAVEVVTPEDYMGDVIGDLNSRRGKVGQHGAAGQQPGDPRPGAPLGDVRLRYRPALAHPGSRHLHDAVRLLPADARRTCRKRSSPACAASSPTAHCPPTSTTHVVVQETAPGEALSWPRRSSSGRSLM